MHQPKTIAITGKGGSGKTMLATLFLKILQENDSVQTLAIDADSAMSLPYTLGITVKQTVSDIREDIIGAQQVRDPDEPLSHMMQKILEHGQGFDLLTMGRPEEPGCYCVVNDLLRYGIDTLSDTYDVVIIDGEAGPEQLNRRVLTNIDMLLVVSDMSERSLRTAQSIMRVVKRSESISVKQSGLILNRYKEGEKTVEDIVSSYDMDVLGTLPEDRVANEFDRQGKPLMDLPTYSTIVRAARKILAELIPDSAPKTR